MSKTTKRKHVTKEALTEYYIPEGEEEIVKIIAGRGNNLHEVESASGKKFLVSMPTKFRKNLWVKRGDFVVVNPIKEGNKVLAEIVYVLYSKQIKYLQSEGFWPEQFNVCRDDEENQVEEKESPTLYDGNFENDSEDDEFLFKNPNRREFNLVEDSDSSEEDESEEEEDETNDHEADCDKEKLAKSNKIGSNSEGPTLAEQLSSVNLGNE